MVLTSGSSPLTPVAGQPPSRWEQKRDNGSSAQRFKTQEGAAGSTGPSGTREFRLSARGRLQLYVVLAFQASAKTPAAEEGCPGPLGHEQTRADPLTNLCFHTQWKWGF